MLALGGGEEERALTLEVFGCDGAGDDVGFSSAAWGGADGC